MKKRIQLHNESITKKKVDTPDDGTALPAYLLDREQGHCTRLPLGLLLTRCLI